MFFFYLHLCCNIQILIIEHEWKWNEWIVTNSSAGLQYVGCNSHTVSCAVVYMYFAQCCMLCKLHQEAKLLPKNVACHSDSLNSKFYAMLSPRPATDNDAINFAFRKVRDNSATAADRCSLRTERRLAVVYSDTGTRLRGSNVAYRVALNLSHFELLNCIIKVPSIRLNFHQIWV